MKPGWLSRDLMVRRPDSRWPGVLTLVLMVLSGWACLLIARHADGWPAAIASALLGLYIGWGCLSFWRAQVGYKEGWIDGRQQMLRSAHEAGKRGMSASAWGDAEWERDMAVLGYTITRTTGERAEDQ